MPYLQIDDFRFGMDRRRRRVSGVPGTLWTGKNVVVTRGGDIERTKSFVSRFSVPNTFGLARIKEQLFVFGSADLAASIPIGVNYQRLQPPSSATMVRVLDAQAFDGKVYAIAEYDDGNIHHFYDGTRVSDWDTVADANISFSLLAEYLSDKIATRSDVDVEAFGDSVTVSAKTAGTAFTISAAAANNGGTNDQTATLTTVQANVSEVAETRAFATLTVVNGSARPGLNLISSITANGVQISAGPVDWQGSNETTATAIAADINLGVASHGFEATVAGAEVTVQAPVGDGATTNGAALTASVPATSNVVASTLAFSGGVTEVPPVAQVSRVAFGGTLDATDQFTITIEGTDYVATPRGAATGTSVYVRRGRVYSTAGSLIRYCVINDATDWTTAVTSADSGFINVAQDSEGAKRLTAMVDYNEVTAVFAGDVLFVYSLNANTDSDSIVSTLPNTGTEAERSVVPYGNLDVFYLDVSGVRSVQPRDSSGDARTDDVGTVIDPFLQEFLESVPRSSLQRAQGAIEPGDDRLFLLIDSRVFIYSRFRSVGISAWTFVDPPFTPTDIIRTTRRLYARDESTIYLYGGLTGAVYDDASTSPPEIELPYMAAEDQAGIKRIKGLDLACEGDWRIDVLPDPNDESKSATVGVFNKITYPLGDVGVSQRTSHVAFKLTGQSAGLLSLSSFAFHYETEAKR